MRTDVELMVAVGMPHVDIARAVGCTVDTLSKHCGEELAIGHAKKRREVLAMLHKAAKGGNVSAQKKLEEMTRVAGAAAEFEQATATAPKTEPLGKKAAAAEAARAVGGAGTEWGDDLSAPGTPLN
jgi:hypothetical protein